MKLYEEIKIKEKAKKLAEEEGVSIEQATLIIRKLRREAEARAKKVKYRSRSSRQAEGKRRNAARNKAVKEFGNKLIPGARPFQGGIPGSGK